ncbi:hypothetical protein LIER_38355 [Lithospermum erythrorhizon]|uniref:RNase H type-1 domain-containing protein n=1 Tax=Lithospermum erythrorhizon TaxID=34254 RepID=A0AAV3Q307_LITER
MWWWWKYRCKQVFGEKQGTTGVIVRDNQGEFMGASFKIIPSGVQVIVAEAMTIRERLEFATRRWDHIDVESDSQILIKAILGEFSVPLEINVVVKDIRAQGRLLDATFRYIRRGSNNVAHTIAH